VPRTSERIGARADARGRHRHRHGDNVFGINSPVDWRGRRTVLPSAWRPYEGRRSPPPPRPPAGRGRFLEISSRRPKASPGTTRPPHPLSPPPGRADGRLRLRPPRRYRHPANAQRVRCPRFRRPPEARLRAAPTAAGRRAGSFSEKQRIEAPVHGIFRAAGRCRTRRSVCGRAERHAATRRAGAGIGGASDELDDAVHCPHRRRPTAQSMGARAAASPLPPRSKALRTRSAGRSFRCCRGRLRHLLALERVMSKAPCERKSTNIFTKDAAALTAGQA